MKNGAITLTGTALNVTAVTIESGPLEFSNESAVAPASRLPAAPVSMLGGTLSFSADSSRSSTMALGMLSGRGQNFISLHISNSSTTPIAGVLSFAGLTREQRGIFSFRTSVFTAFAPNTGAFAFANGLNGQLIGNAAVATSRPILPYAALNGKPATFEPGVGLRALAANEQTTAFAVGQNLLVNSSTVASMNTDLTVNSVELDGTLFGTGTLRVSSGLIAGKGGINPAIDFGSVEGLLLNLSGSGRAQFVGAISGTNGLTVAGSSFYGVALLGNNTFTGPLTLNGGSVYFNTLNSLGADASPIVFSNASLLYSGGAPLTFTRGLDLRAGSSGVASESSSGTVPITLAGPITGPGNLTLSNDVTLAHTGNSYSGNTLIAGTVRIASDAVFGQSPVVSIAANSTPAQLVLSGDWITSRTVQMGTGIIDTGAFHAILHGPLLGAGPLTKMGSGSITIEDGDDFSGFVFVDAGTLRSPGKLAGTGTVTVAAVGRLEGDLASTRPLMAGGIVAPGDGVGTMDTGNLTFQNGSTLELQLVNPASFDQVRVTGSVAFSGVAQLSIDLTGAALGDNFQLALVLNDGGDAISRSAAQGFALGANFLDEGESFLIGEQNFSISYVGGDGNDVVLSVPEPAAGGLLALGLAPLLGCRPRRAPRKRR